MAVAEGKPEWLKVRMPGGASHAQLKETFRRLDLHTVCEEARCPNVGECWRAGTATIMILGDTCTRGCRFCAVQSGNPGGVVDPHEPGRVAAALGEMDLAYVVLTMVDRDDLSDGGAAHVARTVAAIRERCPSLLLETLVGDFSGSKADIETVVRLGKPDVYAHNVEVVPSLQRKMRDARCSWQRSVQTLRDARAAGATVTKTSLMVGCGESEAEVIDTLHELRRAEIDVLTIGQYLRPTPKHAPIERYVAPDEFERYQQAGLALGFKFVASGPLVRSSYRAAEAFLRGVLGATRDTHNASATSDAGNTRASQVDRYGKRRLEVISE